MSATVAISSGALAYSAAANSAAAIAARKTACVSYVNSYKAETATTEEMQQYASCIRLLHPEEMSGGEVIVLKVAIVLALIGMCIGAYKGYKDDGIAVGLFGAIVGAMLLPFAAGCIFGVMAGVVYLFT